MEEAIRLYFKALKIEPDSAEAYNGLGAAMVRRGMIEKAVEHFKKALQLKPDFEDAKRNFENTIEAMEKHKEDIRIKEIKIESIVKSHICDGKELLDKNKQFRVLR